MKNQEILNPVQESDVDLENLRLSNIFGRFERIAGEKDLKHNFTAKLGLENGFDQYIFRFNLALRLLRLEIYNLKSSVNEPIHEAGKKMRIISNVFLALEEKLNEDTAVLKYVKPVYGMLVSEAQPDSTRPRTIELAVNDLVSQNIQPARVNNFSHFAPNNNLLDGWADRWKGELEKQKAQDIVNMGDLRAENV